MEYIYSALLLYSAGKQITEDGIKAVLKSAGITPDDSRVKALVSSLEGVDIKKAIETAVIMPSSQQPTAEEKKEKKEEKKEEKVSEEEAASGLGALFG